MMIVTGTEYTPVRWAMLPTDLRSRIVAADKKLRGTLPDKPPTYASMDGMSIRVKHAFAVRPEISELVKQRQGHGNAVTQEIAAQRRFFEDHIYSKDATVYEVAANARTLFFGTPEPLRNYDMTINTHKWLRIKPPNASCPIFLRVKSYMEGPALFVALSLYLALISAHPFSDGNGRTSRLLFNLHLAHAYGRHKAFVPLSELTRRTCGQYEEAIARANVSGHYESLLDLMVGVLEDYADHLSASSARAEPAFDRVLRQAGELERGEAMADFNALPPYMVSIDDLCGHPFVSSRMLSAIVDVEHALRPFGTVEFAMTNLGALAGSAEQKKPAVWYFFNPTKRTDLVAHFRVLRTQQKVISPRVVLRTGDPVVDAKLLTNLTSAHTMDKCCLEQCLIFLCDLYRSPGSPHLSSNSATIEAAAHA